MVSTNITALLMFIAFVLVLILLDRRQKLEKQIKCSGDFKYDILEVMISEVNKQTTLQDILRFLNGTGENDKVFKEILSNNNQATYKQIQFENTNYIHGTNVPILILDKNNLQEIQIDELRKLIFSLIKDVKPRVLNITELISHTLINGYIVTNILDETEMEQVNLKYPNILMIGGDINV